MKVLLLLLLAALATAETVHDGVIFDMFNFLEIIDNDDQIKAILSCIWGQTPCGEYQIIKEKGPNILKTKCSDCNPEQRAKFQESIKKFELKHNEEYKKLMAKYLPA